MVPSANSVLGSTKGIECINGGQKICKPRQVSSLQNTLSTYFQAKTPKKNLIVIYS